MYLQDRKVVSQDEFSKTEFQKSALYKVFSSFQPTEISKELFGNFAHNFLHKLTKDPEETWKYTISFIVIDTRSNYCDVL